MAEFKLAPRAERDLEEIWHYTVEQWSVEQAENYVHGLIDAMDALAESPLRGRSAEEVRPGYRRHSVGAHVIFYVPKNYGVAIIRVLHQRMDFDAHFE
jgi:toxin ParE1/3/4